MAKVIKSTDELKSVMQSRAWSVEELAQKIGDESERLEAVLEGKEALGTTASLALYALENDLPPISR